MKTETYTLPSHWASALISGDWSGLEALDEKELNDFLEREKQGSCLTCSEQSIFAWSNDGYPYRIGCDCLEFTFTRH